MGHEVDSAETSQETMEGKALQIGLNSVKSSENIEGVQTNGNSGVKATHADVAPCLPVKYFWIVFSMSVPHIPLPKIIM